MTNLPKMFLVKIPGNSKNGDLAVSRSSKNLCLTSIFLSQAPRVQLQVDIAGTLTKVNLDLAGAPSKGDPVAKPGEHLGDSWRRQRLGLTFGPGASHALKHRIWPKRARSCNLDGNIWQWLRLKI